MEEKLVKVTDTYHLAMLKMTHKPISEGLTNNHYWATYPEVAAKEAAILITTSPLREYLTAIKDVHVRIREMKLQNM